MKQRQHLKNRPSYGSKLLKMDDNTYALRRKVIDIIYLAKKEVNLPRVEVRIVEGAQWDKEGYIMGYAYMGKNIIHIEKRYVGSTNTVLTTLVLHEILHAVLSTKHNDKCPLMKPYISELVNLDEIWKTFKSYFK